MKQTTVSPLISSKVNSKKNNTMANRGKVQNTSPLRIQRLKETMNLTR